MEMDESTNFNEWWHDYGKDTDGYDTVSPSNTGRASDTATSACHDTATSACHDWSMVSKDLSSPILRLHCKHCHQLNTDPNHDEVPHCCYEEVRSRCSRVHQTNKYVRFCYAAKDCQFYGIDPNDDPFLTDDEEDNGLLGKDGGEDIEE